MTIKAKRGDFDTMTYELADLGERLISAIIDGIILGVVTGALFGAAREPGFGIGWLIGLAYYWYFWTRQNGQTPGKSLMKLRVIKTDGSPMSDADAIIRYIGYSINSIFIGLGWLWALFDSNRQGWHDKIANTYVVRAQ